VNGERLNLDVDAAGVARLRLAAPERRNAIDPAWVAQLGEAVDRCTSGVRVLLISAAGPAFTVGGDLQHFSRRLDDLDRALDEMIPAYHAALEQIASLEAPVVAAINGAIAGGGLGLAWCSDIVIASEDAVFATAFAKLGLSGDGGSSWWLPRLVGLRRAQELLLRNRILRAQEALEWGLVTEVVAADALQARAEAVASELAAGPTHALGQIRRLLRLSASHTLGEQLAAEADASRACGTTAEAREGIAAFAEQRAPRFGGRR
jgi:2-(1,2-epoxy-1,2-dihydrophenyl)acetyl-CoA isomerase